MNFNSRQFNKIIYLTFCLVIVFTVTYGYIYTTSKIKNQIASELQGYESIKRNNTDIDKDVKKAVAQTIITDKTILTLKTYYKKCGDVVVDSSTVSGELLKLDENNFKMLYKDWNVLQFNSDEIILLKEVNDDCPEKYILKEKEGKVAVYYQKPVNGNILRELTNISVDSLPSMDQQRLKEGINVNSKEELAQLLEDMGS